MHRLSKRLIMSTALFFLVAILLIVFMFIRVGSLNNSIEANDNISVIKDKIDKLSRLEIDATKLTKHIIHPLSLACFKGNYETAIYLVGKGVDVNAKSRKTGNTPILYTLEGGNGPEQCNIAMYLIEHGADINAENKNGESLLTRLMWDAPDSKEAIDLFKYIYINSNHLDEYAAFHLAADDDVPELVDWLIKEQGFSYSDLRQEDESYLHYYYREAESGNLWRKPKMIEYIVNCKLEDINTQDKEGRTVLGVAAEKNEVEDCKLFLKLGADPSIKDNSGKTAYDYALENGNAEVAELLRSDMK